MPLILVLKEIYENLVFFHPVHSFQHVSLLKLGNLPPRAFIPACASIRVRRVFMYSIEMTTTGNTRK